MREFIKLIETEWTDESDEMDARGDRERHVETLIRHVIGKLGMDLADRNHAVNYDESSGRECTFYVFGPVPVSTLAKMEGLGLGTDFKVSPYGDELMIEFVVAEGMESATPQ